MFRSLQRSLVEGLPQEPYEWRRSYGRVAKPVCVEADFVAFSVETLPPEKPERLIGIPILHTFWTDCVVSPFASPF